MASSKNELYEITGCELDHVNGEYIYNSKVDCHVHKSGKIHMYRTSKDYIWTIADSTRRKQYCFAQKIAPHPTGCSWNVYTGGVGGELLTSSMRVFNNTEFANASPLKRISTNKTSGKLSPMNTSLKAGPKLTSDKVSPLIPLTPVAPPARPKASPSTEIESKTSPSFKVASASAAASAKQTIINISNNILGGNKGATVVRKSETPKNVTHVPVSLEVQVPVQDTHQVPESVSPRVSPRTSPIRVHSIDTTSVPVSPVAVSPAPVSPGYSSRMSLFAQVLEIEARVLQVPSVDGQTLQVIVPATALSRLESRQTLPAQTLTEWKEVEATWADATATLDQEVVRAHQRIAELSKALEERNTDLELLRGIYEESQEQERVAREELLAQLSLADATQEHFATEREEAALEQARIAQEKTEAALQREKGALRREDAALEKSLSVQRHADIARAQARTAHDQAEVAQRDARTAKAAIVSVQTELREANEKIQTLQEALSAVSVGVDESLIQEFELSLLGKSTEIEEIQCVVEDTEGTAEALDVVAPVSVDGGELDVVVPAPVDGDEPVV